MSVKAGYAHLSGEEPMQTIALLTISNIFMTIAWYRHLGGK
ncbi:MAG: DMT family protein [Nitrospirota bacterium]|nr:DMT family protein [Nitrospirota bacterium]MDE3118789.1 DMT family protein [Nitrospirota bacterium]MDE3243077.1 DMT family protein [Nitrospirota bacterium]